MFFFDGFGSHGISTYKIIIWQWQPVYLLSEKVFCLANVCKYAAFKFWRSRIWQVGGFFPFDSPKTFWFKHHPKLWWWSEGTLDMIHDDKMCQDLFYRICPFTVIHGIDPSDQSTHRFSTKTRFGKEFQLGHHYVQRLQSQKWCFLQSMFRHIHNIPGHMFRNCCFQTLPTGRVRFHTPPFFASGTAMWAKLINWAKCGDRRFVTEIIPQCQLFLDSCHLQELSEWLDWAA